MRIEHFSLILGDHFSISLVLLVAILIFGVVALLQLRTGFKLAIAETARKLNELYDRSQALPRFRPPSGEERLQFQDNPAFQALRNECIALGCEELFWEVEEHESIIAMHSVWTSERFGCFVEFFVASHDPNMKCKVLWRMLPGDHLVVVSDMKLRNPSIPGVYTRLSCDPSDSIETMMVLLKSGDSNWIQLDRQLDAAMFARIRERHLKIKQDTYQIHDGVMPLETLKSMAGKKSTFFLKIIRKEMARQRQQKRTREPIDVSHQDYLPREDGNPYAAPRSDR